MDRYLRFSHPVIDFCHWLVVAVSHHVIHQRCSVTMLTTDVFYYHDVQYCRDGFATVVFRRTTRMRVTGTMLIFVYALLSFVRSVPRDWSYEEGS